MAITMGHPSQWVFELCHNVITMHRDGPDANCKIIVIQLKLSLVITMRHHSLDAS